MQNDFRFWSVLLVLLILIPSLNSLVPSPGGPTVPACIKTLTVSRGENPWREYTSSAAEEEGSMHIAAVTMTKDLETIPSLIEYSDGNSPWLARDRPARRIVANDRIFSDLNRVDATRLQAGEELTIGSVKHQELDADRLLTFLLISQIVQTYIHIEANLCVLSETDAEGRFVEQISGKHVYYTSRRHESGLRFSLILDRKSGKMSIQGR